METTQGKEVKKLKLNVTNINSFLKKSNKDYVAIKKNNKRLVSDQNKIKKTKEKEKTIEKKGLSGSSPLSNVKQVAESSAGIFDKILSFGGILLSGILLNALPSIKKKVDKFAEDNKEIIGNVTKSLIVVKDFTLNLFNAFTGPYSQENSLDWLGKFNDSGKLESGILKKVEQAFDSVGKLINDIDKALGGEGKIGNFVITGERILAKQGGQTGEYNLTTKEFTPRAFTEEENRRYQSGDFRSEGSTNNQTPFTGGRDSVDQSGGERDSRGGGKKGHYYFPLPNGRFAGSSAQYYGAGRNYGGHAGIDLTEKPPYGSKPNIDVVALVGGTVIGDKYLAGKEYMSGMMIKGNDGNDQRYLHMTPMLKVGDSAKAGQKIGELVDMREVGRSIDETHLHFEVYRSGRGGHLDPHKIYPQFFRNPNTAPKSFDNRSKSSGGNMSQIIPSNNKTDQLAVLNTTVGEKGSTTIIHARQPILN
jgi:murein DD-endopeptidase MepM/ murein hydrolase activator NlpD